ncbi:MAG TPA: GNAT family N-acetyltransferase [Terrimicrobiaceae bacterium]
MPSQALPRISRRSDPQTTRVDRRLSLRPLEVNVVDPTADADWDRLVASHPDFTFFHSAAWTRVLRKTYGHKSVSLNLSQLGETKALVPLLEVASPLTGRRGIGLPFTDFCDPLFFGEYDPRIVESLRALARQRGWKYFEIRGDKTSALSARPSLAFYGHALDLRSGTKALFEGFSSSVRRAIRKAESHGLDVQLSESEEAMREFYRLHVQTRRRHGLPPQPMAFFRNIHSEIIKRGSGFVVLAHRGPTPVAAAVFFQMGRKAIYKFGASDEKHQELRGNNLVMWHAIRSLAERGFESLHFGRTSRENEGLRRFKLAWGAVEEPIEYFRFDTRANDWIVTRDNVSGFHNSLFSRLPLALNRLIGAVLYPHLD